MQQLQTSGASSSSHKIPTFNITLWEDWSRKKKPLEEVKEGENDEANKENEREVEEEEEKRIEVEREQRRRSQFYIHIHMNE